jgi:hypothetical protein
MKKFHYLCLLLICFGYLHTIAQNQSASSPDSLSYISFEKALTALQQKYNVKFYFDSDRLLNRKVHKSVAEMPLEQAKAQLERITGYYLLKINAGSFVFLPYESPTQNQQVQDYYTVGNPLDFGKYSNATVEGRVVDGKTGEPLTGAVVSYSKQNLAVNTDKDGNFSIKLPVGEQELSLKFYGYEESNAKLKIYGKGSVKFELFEKSINLDEVIVRAEMAQNGVMRNQMSLVRIDAKAIKELPVSMGETDIIKSVTLMPGVQSVGEFGSGFNVRGGSADQNLVLMEDLPVFNSSHVFGLISIVNSDDISSVTLLKAGIPARYGERASSVLDIKMGGSQPEKITAKGGIGLINSRLNLKVPLFNKKVVWSIGGRSSYSDWLLKKIPDMQLQNSSAKFSDLNSSLTISPNSSNRISLFGYYSHDFFRFDGSTEYQYDNLLGGIRWSHSFSNTFSMNMMAGRSKYNLQVDEDVDKSTDWSRVKSKVNYDVFRWNFSLTAINNNSLDFGLNAVRYNIDPGKLTPGDSSSTTQPKKVQDEQAYELSGYLSDNITVSDKINIEAGIRFTRYMYVGPYNARIYLSGQPRNEDNLAEVKTYKKDETIYGYNAFEPRISAIYKINGESSVKISYSKIHQFMNLISNTSVMAPTDVWKLSDNNIAPLICNQVAVGYYRNFNRNLLETSVELYYKQLNNIIEYKEGATLLMNQSIETDLIPAKGYNYGIEFYVKKNNGRLTGWASYTFSRSLRKTTSVFDEEQIRNNKYFPSNFDKPNNLIIQSNYHISKRWRFSSTFMYSTGRPTTLPELKYYYNGVQQVVYSYRNKYRLPDFHRLDVSITLDESLRRKKKWKGSWTFSIVNLYGRKNAYSSFYQRETPSAENDYKTYNLYTLYIIGIPFPTLTYNFTF